MTAFIIGLVAILLGILGIIKWTSDFILVLKGSIPTMLICGGIIGVIAGVIAIKDSVEIRKLEKERQKEGDK